MTRKILVVDDEPDMEMLMRQKFRRQIASGAFQMQFAKNGAEALELLTEDQSIELVMSDINMPVMNGLELLERIAERNIPSKCIVVSAYNDVLNIRTAMNRGAFDFVTKPIDFNDLEATIAKTLAAVDELKEIGKARIERDTAIIEKEKAIISEKFKQQFLANMSHEIRTPMNSVIGITNLLMRSGLNADQRNYLNMIKAASEQLMAIINDILDISKIEAGKLQLEKIPINIEQILKNVRDILVMRANEKNLEIRIVSDPGLAPSYLGDPFRLTQILLNLAGNSIKFTENGFIELKVEQRISVAGLTTLTFSVTDTGIGIAPEKQVSIFESFTQAESDTSRKYGGTGLGLAISKQLVELHGGKIDVKSTSGKGTVFYFSIDYEPGITIESVKTKAFDISSLNGIKILLTEDNEFNKIVAEDTLNKYLEGITIDHASNGRVAIEKVNQNKYDLVLMDIQMPEMDGYEATQAIRKMASEKNRIPIIAMTANATPEEIKKCFDSGVDGYVSKPFVHDDLFYQISEAIAKNKSA
ncbi:MAG TPA: response regulator [Bacteroidia bacterium]|nr:response regulator [Bacteroidia bacterium]